MLGRHGQLCRENDRLRNERSHVLYWERIALEFPREMEWYHMDAWLLAKAVLVVLIGSLQHGDMTESQSVNHPPRFLYEIPVQETIKLASVVEINGDDIFTDDDGDDLVFSAMSQSSSMASVKVEGSMIKVTPHKTGEVAIIIAASDQKGGMAKAVYRFVVKETGKKK
jgi:hypothetical protein